MLKDVTRLIEDTPSLTIRDPSTRCHLPVLRFPAVANKSFLITIADRSITGMVARDQMVGHGNTCG